MFIENCVEWLKGVCYGIWKSDVNINNDWRRHAIIRVIVMSGFDIF